MFRKLLAPCAAAHYLPETAEAGFCKRHLTERETLPWLARPEHLQRGLSEAHGNEDTSAHPQLNSSLILYRPSCRLGRLAFPTSDRRLLPPEYRHPRNSLNSVLVRASFFPLS
ncbi:hypothetical protein EJ02DRAFT_51908 [Clathrospora elynae]|uniref:Uncharacterized protein n=1 Tax=Clathrospora elynae TaxID=706981 RepID=A0A6A5T020_9PLEO|nr:hypothetical protein EJ02DRAFT_51908 [Clathrospora elynae]